MSMPKLSVKSQVSSGLFLSALILCSGCGTTKQEQLEQAAKDWCATVRASQIMPVYPLTEDVQPGDIFLVQITIDQQQKIFNQKGYLPLDNHLDRLNPLAYPRFYGNSFLASNTNIILPAAWLRPNHQLTNSWAIAPNAAFPSYSFAIRRGAGINLAFPVQGVPVGLSLLGSDAADGTVIIKNAHTLGVDTLSLYGQLKIWASTNSEFLNNFGSDSGTNYLRVVSRIYTVGYVDISLRDASSRSGGLDVGAPKPVDLLTPQLPQGTNADSATTRSNFVAGTDQLQQLMTNALAAKDALGNLLPGGSLRLTAASSRTISMRETFEPPLTIGYLGFDCAIMRNGELGPPIPTYAVLSTNFNLRPLSAKPRTQRLFDFAVYRVIQEQPADDRRANTLLAQLDALVTFVPTNFVTYQVDDYSKTNFILAADQIQSGVLRNPKKNGFALLLSYKDMVERSVDSLEKALPQNKFTLLERDPPNQPRQQSVFVSSMMHQILANQLEHYRDVFTKISADPAYQKAMSAAYDYAREKL